MTRTYPSDKRLYRVYWWDHERDGWVLQDQQSRLIDLRADIKDLRASGFDDDSSIYVIGPGYTNEQELPEEPFEDVTEEPQQLELFA
jgi:hypothetical protein